MFCNDRANAWPNINTKLEISIISQVYITSKYIFWDWAVKRIISKIFCNPEEWSIKRDFHLHFLRESITDTCLLSSLDRFIVLIWKTDIDSRISVGSPWIQMENSIFSGVPTFGQNTASLQCAWLLGHLKNINFPFETNGKLMIVGAPILKHFRVFRVNK